MISILLQYYNSRSSAPASGLIGFILVSIPRPELKSQVKSIMDNLAKVLRTTGIPAEEFLPQDDGGGRHEIIDC